MPRVLFRPILSRGSRADFDTIIAHVNDAIDSVVKPELIAKHEENVADWNIEVGFGSLKRVNRNGISVFVYPKGENKEIYGYVTKGTPAHDIPKQPKPPGTALKFRWNGPGSYTPKTAPFAGPPRLIGGHGLGGFVHFKQVHHPGIEPRLFEKKIGDEYMPRFRSVVEAAFKRGIRAANRG